LARDLDWLNSLNKSAAEDEFLKCCGSQAWSERMARERPFSNIDDLLAKANYTWWSLKPEDWLEAFRSHPKIGEKKAARNASEQSRTWSEQEQSGTRNAGLETQQALADLNKEYEQKFGYIFIVCATGKSSEEMLQLLRQRMTNDPEREMRIAAEEQSRITRLRLEKLLEQ
jgi:OHCU decarboxylase